MSEIRVVFAELDNAQGSINTAWGQITHHLEDLKTYLRPMTHTWSGDAAIAYQAHQARWDQSMAGLNDVLNQIRVALGTSNQNYQEGEAHNMKRWQH